MPESALRMIICSCNVLSDRDIKEAVASAEADLNSTAQVYNCLGCLVHCGLCSRSVRRLLRHKPLHHLSSI
ncbi:(2Fe-2S)-binding protein [Bradyrhizobium sp. UFLA05-112]